MNQQQIFGVMKEFQKLFTEFQELAETKALDGQLDGKTWDEKDEAIRSYAQKAANIVVTHAKWPADLAQKMDYVLDYIKSHPEQADV